MLVGDGVNLLLVAIVPIGVGLRRLDPSSARLWSVLGFPLRFYLALVQLLGPGIFFEQLVELLQVFWRVSDAMAVQDTGSKTVDCIMDCYVIVNRWQLRLEREELFIVFSKTLLLLLLEE
jgi:hypothetical protein